MSATLHDSQYITDFRNTATKLLQELQVHETRLGHYRGDVINFFKMTYQQKCRQKMAKGGHLSLEKKC